MDKINRPHRRTFLYCLAACAAGTFALEPWVPQAFATEVLFQKGSPYTPLNDGLPAKPVEEPLAWKSIADA